MQRQASGSGVLGLAQALAAVVTLAAFVAASASAAQAQACTGDCGGNGEVTVDEVLTGLNIALGLRQLDECAAMDANLDGIVTVDELITALTYALTGCPGSGPTATPTATPTPPLPPTFTATATRTTTPTEPPSGGPLITHFGLVTADRKEILPTGTTEDGLPIFERIFGAGFLIVVEGRPGISGAPLGQCNTSYDEFSSEVRPDLQILSNRNLGRGDPAVCDGAAIQPTGSGCGNRPPSIEPPGGGIPAVDPPVFDQTSKAVADALNDFGCRMAYKGQSEPCTVSAFDNPRYLNTQSTDQFCTENVVSPGDMLFPHGDTILTARWRDTAGNLGAPRRIVVRVR
jgi:hypothetical protein